MENDERRTTKNGEWKNIEELKPKTSVDVGANRDREGEHGRRKRRREQSKI